MFSLFNKTKKSKEKIIVNGRPYTLNLTYEKRRNSRVSLTKSGINIRIDNRLPKAKQSEQLDKFLIWAKDTIEKKGHDFVNLQKTYKNGEVLVLFDSEISVKFNYYEGKRVKGNLSKGVIEIFLPSELNNADSQKYISKMVYKLLAKKYQTIIEEKIHLFNTKFKFGEINKVRLKNNSSNWGSCSSKNNINISVRLLLAPENVVDYVIIHELCHLVHRNHSNKFWDLVEKCFPNYKEAELWLKQNASKCII